MIDILYNRIREDLVNNRKELFNMHHYYTHKYRSNDRMLDINVGLFRNDEQQNVVQIYIANQQIRLREQLFLDNGMNIVDSKIIVKELN